MRYKCVVCNYDGLFEEPYTNGIASDEICPCCGFQYGLDDFENREKSYKAWRKKWVDNGCVWYSKGRKAPENWLAIEQIKSIK